MTDEPEMSGNAHSVSDLFADASDPAATDETYRLIGQFVVRFSHYVAVFVHGISSVSRGSPIQNRILWSLTESMTEAELRGQFFSATALFREPTEPERRIRLRLGARAEALARKRNLIAHGVWFLETNTDQGTSYEPTLHRTRAKKEGPDHMPVLESRDELRGLVAEAEALLLLFSEYSQGLLAEQSPSVGTVPSVTERLGFVDGELVRLDLSNWTTPQ